MSGFEEVDTYEPLVEEIERRIDSKYECYIEKNIPYSLNYDGGNNINKETFSTDISIFEGSIPRVVIEVKNETVSTHGIMYTNDKAEKHKQVFPFLRYGLLVTNSKRRLTKKYLWHNRVLDFIYKSRHDMDDEFDYDTQEMDELAKIIEQNIEYSQEYEKILENKSNKYVMTHRSEFL